MKPLIGICTVALISGLAMGDTILENGGSPTFTNIPGSIVAPTTATGVPYWNNTSTDCGASTTTCNVGNFLTNTGAIASGTNYNPNQYLSGAGSGGSNDAAPSFNLVHSTNSLIISLIGVYTGNTTDQFGIYNAALTGAAATASRISLFGTNSALGSSMNESSIAFANVGFYMTNTINGVTWYSNSGLNVPGSSGDPAGHQHFALFTTGTDPNMFFLGITDWITGNGGEGNGDYQDLVIRVNADAVVPEPATFALMGAGLLGLGFARFRTRKSRA
jgi:hypothetical protein